MTLPTRKTFFRAARGLAGARDGNVAIMFGLLLIPVLLAGGMAVDLSRSGHAKAVIQEAADTALLRAARMQSSQLNITDKELSAIARRVFNAATTKLTSVSIENFAVTYDKKAGVFNLNLRGDMKTTLLNVVGIGALPINTMSAVTLGKPPYIEVALALDNTGSMKQKNKLKALKDASKELVEALFAQPNGGVKIGLAPFAQYVNVGEDAKNAPWMAATSADWTGCVGSRAYPAELKDDDYEAKPVPGVDKVACPSALLPLTDDKAAVLNALDKMTASGDTYIPAGLVWGWRLISPQTPFDEGLSSSEINKIGGIKALVLLSDGENTRAPSYPTHESANAALANNLMILMCDAVKAQGVVVYTVAFDISDPTIRGLMEECGTTPGHYFTPSNKGELGEAFLNIATSLRSLSLSR